MGLQDILTQIGSLLSGSTMIGGYAIPNALIALVIAVIIVVVLARK